MAVIGWATGHGRRNASAVITNMMEVPVAVKIMLGRRQCSTKGNLAECPL